MVTALSQEECTQKFVAVISNEDVSETEGVTFLSN